MSAAAEKLKASIREGRAMHGYIVTGDPSAVDSLILECAALLLFGNTNTELLALSPDYFLLDGTIRVDDIREIRREVTKTTFSTKNRVVIIKNAHLMNAFSINAMLKMLEEPPEGTYFFLSGNELRIIPTIRSRCMTVRLGESSTESAAAALKALGASEAEAGRFARESCGSVSVAKRLFEDEGFRLLRSSSLSAFSDMLAGKLPFAFVKKLERSKTAAVDSVEFMLLACHDLLAFRSRSESGIMLCCADHEDELREFAEKFSFETIGNMISCLTEASRRLTSNAGGNQLLDRLIVDINGIVTGSGRSK